MTDISKYKNVSVPKHSTYADIGRLTKTLVPDATISRTQVINILVAKAIKRLNGKGDK
jgi:hypothetical protein